MSCIFYILQYKSILYLLCSRLSSILYDSSLLISILYSLLSINLFFCLKYLFFLFYSILFYSILSYPILYMYNSMTYYIFYSVFLLGIPQPFCSSPVLSFTHPVGLHCSHSLTPIVQSTESYGLSLLFVFQTISFISVSSQISFLDLIYLRNLSIPFIPL